MLCYKEELRLLRLKLSRSNLFLTCSAKGRAVKKQNKLWPLCTVLLCFLFHFRRSLFFFLSKSPKKTSNPTSAGGYKLFPAKTTDEKRVLINRAIQNFGFRC